MESFLSVQIPAVRTQQRSDLLRGQRVKLSTATMAFKNPFIQSLNCMVNVTSCWALHQGSSKHLKQMWLLEHSVHWPSTCTLFSQLQPVPITEGCNMLFHLILNSSVTTNVWKWHCRGEASLCLMGRADQEAFHQGCFIPAAEMGVNPDKPSQSRVALLGCLHT